LIISIKISSKKTNKKKSVIKTGYKKTIIITTLIIIKISIGKSIKISVIKLLKTKKCIY
jgi:hypothetical protein